MLLASPVGYLGFEQILDAVPEPRSFALILFGPILFFALRRRDAADDHEIATTNLKRPWPVNHPLI